MLSPDLNGIKSRLSEQSLTGTLANPYESKVHEQEFADNFTKSLKEAREDIANLKSD